MVWIQNAFYHTWSPVAGSFAEAHILRPLYDSTLKRSDEAGDLLTHEHTWSDMEFYSL